MAVFVNTAVYQLGRKGLAQALQGTFSNRFDRHNRPSRMSIIQPSNGKIAGLRLRATRNTTTDICAEQPYDPSRTAPVEVKEMKPPFRNHNQNSDVRMKASSAEREARKAKTEIDRLKAKVEALNLTCQALWELLKQCSDLTDEDLSKQVREIDLRDGEEDGRVRQAPMDCPKCGRAVSRTSGKCIYCGHAISRDPFGNPT